MDNSPRLSKDDWLKAARLALLHKGPDGVRVEPLAKELGVTKGSFYWHFKDRNDLLEAILREWEEETDILLENLGELDPHRALEKIFEEVKRRTLASERGEAPSDVAIFTWAQLDPEVAKRVNKSEDERMGLLRNFAAEQRMADFFYYAYQGLLFRRRRIPKAVKDFDMIAELAMELMPMKKKSSKAKKIINAAKKSAGLLLIIAATSLQACSLYRTARWQDPQPDVQDKIFPYRVVHHADVPFHFIKGTPRNDLDTVDVRDIDGKKKPSRSISKIERSTRSLSSGTTRSSTNATTTTNRISAGARSPSPNRSSPPYSAKLSRRESSRVSTIRSSNISPN
jgi:AcrR family transcriptional regulator